MIVPSMTPQEVFREMDRDMGHLWAWREVTFKSMAKRARQMMKFPQTIWYDHETPRHNRYLFMSTIYDRNFYKKSIGLGVALQKAERGWAVCYVVWPHMVKFNKKVMLLPHVFDRYADPERGNVQKTGIELIKHFVSHNYEGWAMRDNRFAGRSVRYKDRDNLCLSIQDGVLLGEEVNDIFVAHTFITYDMASGLQSEAFEKKRSRLMTADEHMKKLREIEKIIADEMV